MTMGNRGYSEDLRDRTMKAIDRGMSVLQASRTFGLNRQTIYNWMGLRKTTGRVTARPIPSTIGRPASCTPQEVAEVFQKNPSFTQKQAAAYLGVSAGAVARARKKAGITRKKNSFYILKEIRRLKKPL